MRYVALVFLAILFLAGCSTGTGNLSKGSSFGPEAETAVLNVDFVFVDSGPNAYVVRIAPFIRMQRAELS